MNNHSVLTAIEDAIDAFEVAGSFDECGSPTKEPASIADEIVVQLTFLVLVPLTEMKEVVSLN